METPNVPTLTEMFEKMIKENRKFEVTDVAFNLHDEAKAYAASYTGNFSFMLDMRQAVARGRFTLAQAKGTLNCMLAEYKRAARKVEEANEPAPVVSSTRIPEGVYMMEVDGEKVNLRIAKVTFGDFPEGTMTVKSAAGKDWYGFAFLFPDKTTKVWNSKRDYTKKQQAALKVLVADEDPLHFGFAYSLNSGKCFICNTELSDPVSVKSGIGPTCAKNIGYDREKLTMEEAALAKKVREARAG